MSCWIRNTFLFIVKADGETIGCIVGSVGWNRSRYRENVAVTERCNVAFSVMPGYDAYISNIDITESVDRKLINNIGKAYDFQLGFLSCLNLCVGEA